MAFNAVERNRKFGRIQCQKKEEGRGVFLCKRIVGGKINANRPNKLSENCGKGAVGSGGRVKKGRQLAEFGGDQNQSSTKFRE